MSYSHNCVGGLLLVNRYNKKEKVFKLFITHLQKDKNIRDALRKTIANFNCNIGKYKLYTYVFAFYDKNALHTKRKLSALLVENKLERWDIQNDQQYNTVDIYDWCFTTRELLDDFFYNHDIVANANYFWCCPMCNEYINIEDKEDKLPGDNLIVCYNADMNIHNGYLKCGLRIHDKCLSKYLRTYPIANKNVNHPKWTCHLCN